MEADRLARQWQSRGVPVVISYLGGVVGTHDLYLGEPNRMIVAMLRSRLPIELHGELPVADVRYVAAGHAALLEPGRARAVTC